MLQLYQLGSWRENNGWQILNLVLEHKKGVH